MTFRSDIVKRIQKREETIFGLRMHADEIINEIEAHEAVVDELKAILKTLPLDDEAEHETADPALRPGSEVAQAREHLQAIGKPTHVDDLLKLIGKQVSKKSRASLSGQMSLYARKNQIFTRPAPNTFGLREWLATSPKTFLPPDDGEALPLPTKDLGALPLPIDDDEVLPAN